MSIDEVKHRTCSQSTLALVPPPGHHTREILSSLQPASPPPPPPPNMSDPAVLPPIYPSWLVPVQQVLLASAICFRANRVLTYALLPFEIYWLIVLPSYRRAPNSTWSDAYGYGSMVAALAGQSVSFLLCMQPDIDFIRVRRRRHRHRHLSREDIQQLPVPPAEAEQRRSTSEHHEEPSSSSSSSSSPPPPPLWRR